MHESEGVPLLEKFQQHDIAQLQRVSLVLDQPFFFGTQFPVLAQFLRMPVVFHSKISFCKGDK